MISPSLSIHRRTGCNTLIETVAMSLVLNGIEEIVLIVDDVDLWSPTVEI